jgi:hypothetical protein
MRFVFSKGVAANCASALAQMAAASCVQEEKEEREAQEPSDAIAQGNSHRARITWCPGHGVCAPAPTHTW